MYSIDYLFTELVRALNGDITRIGRITGKYSIVAHIVDAIAYVG